MRKGPDVVALDVALALALALAQALPLQQSRGVDIGFTISEWHEQNLTEYNFTQYYKQSFAITLILTEIIFKSLVYKKICSTHGQLIWLHCFALI